MQNSLESINWKSLCPWLLLVDSLRVAFRVRVLLLSFVALLLIVAVASFLERVVTSPLSEPTGLELVVANDNDQTELAGESFAGNTARNLLLPWRQLAFPVMATFSGPWSIARSSAVLVLWLFQIVVWAVLGGAICRIAALALTRGEAPNMAQALKFAKRNYGAFFAAPTGTLVGVLFASLPLVVLGLLMRVEWLSYVAAVLWPLALLLGLGIALLTIGLILGFPMMFAAVAVEETDAFDAVSRAFAYVYQRPLRLLWYVLIAALLGWLGGLFVELALTVTQAMTEGAVAWGRGSDSVPATGRKIVRFWNSGLSIFRVAYYYAFFWSAAVGIYLLLRRDIDSVQLDEVTVEPMDSYTPSPLVAATSTDS